MAQFEEARDALRKTVKRVWPSAKPVEVWKGVDAWAAPRPPAVAKGEAKTGYDPRVVVIGIADRKAGPTIYFLDPGDYFALATHKKLLADAGLSVGRGCIYHARKEPLPTKALETLFRLTKERDAAAKAKAEGTKAKAKGRVTTVDEYLATLPGAQRLALMRLRKLVGQAAPEAEEVMSYGIPTWRHAGRSLVHMAAFKDHCSFFPGSTIERIPKADLAKWKTSKGTIQFAPNKPLPAPLVKRIVKMRAAENEALAAKRQKR